MCTTRSWKSINQAGEDSIIVRRSDGIILKFYEAEFVDIVHFVNKLESFRNCKCSLEGPCDEHSEEKERIT